ncbi:hypothetical protein [Laceyella tengchongensis]|uniref:hypothetical protein n=1 Tax=Laceyella tengchongensis TaxID=574699 RepID=UPI001310131C|nr:hypothetical protein [Laceyella tengchongensis]
MLNYTLGRGHLKAGTPSNLIESRFVSFAATAGRMIGPVFGAIVVERGGAERMLWIMSAILLIPIAHFACYHLFAKETLHAHQPSQ